MDTATLRAIEPPAILAALGGPRHDAERQKFVRLVAEVLWFGDMPLYREIRQIGTSRLYAGGFMAALNAVLEGWADESELDVRSYERLRRGALDAIALADFHDRQMARLAHLWIGRALAGLMKSTNPMAHASSLLAAVVERLNKTGADSYLCGVMSALYGLLAELLAEFGRHSDATSGADIALAVELVESGVTYADFISGLMRRRRIDWQAADQLFEWLERHWVICVETDGDQPSKITLAPFYERLIPEVSRIAA
jgi:hypothetical protein